ncbi:DNA-binding transcriptional regulator, MerR family [Amycolatopsis pretoriensis]|uniref:DNA-binding transcriptional regulator, MerR family n=1 Tax=Amycolatopsis pretoriensis TaxID=218821 RepID=A0A1H5QTR2_9PSEU|nr:DNA-binding transcriptional regulator, MerR family [Amycolatopsis pretoriensis]
MRPADLAREHGISTQAVRNYEQDGFLPPADRTASGYRIYTDAHASALRAFLALVPAYGHATAGGIMHAVHDDDLGRALTLVDRGHEQLLRDRETLNAVRTAISHLTTAAPEPAATDFSIGELAHRLAVTAATIRAWERAGILVPRRNPATGYRVFTAADIRDAELTHLLRRGGYPLEHIATVIGQVRTAGGTESLVDALETWREKLTARGVAMLDAAGLLGAYLRSRP